MQRQYFVSEDLDDLADIERQLQEQGLSEAQFHVLSENDGGVDQRHLHDVNSLMRRDVLHSWQMGAMVGFIVAMLVLLVAYFTGATQGAAGWVPFLFLAVVAFGFCVWEGGLFGLRKPNVHFRRFERELKQGKHVFFVEVDAQQASAVKAVLSKHPSLQSVGSGRATPQWFISWKNKWRHFVEVMP